MAALLLALSACLAPGGPAAANSACIAPRPLVHFAAPLPGVARAIAEHSPLRIVAFGSSSTAGAGASDVSRSYPSRLQAALTRLLPGQTVEVVNRGRGGELITHMLARIDRDVLANRPTLVIWQTGVNDAVRGIELARFTADLEMGVERIQAAGSDVVLLDQQYYPKAIRNAAYRSYIEAVHAVAARKKVAVFRRYELMAHLVESAQFRIEQLLAPDQFHQNDLSYECLGTTLADALRETVRDMANRDMAKQQRPGDTSSTRLANQ